MTTSDLLAVVRALLLGGHSESNLAAAALADAFLEADDHEAADALRCATRKMYLAVAGAPEVEVKSFRSAREAESYEEGFDDGTSAEASLENFDGHGYILTDNLPEALDFL